MPDIHVSCSTDIAAPVSTVQRTLTDFETWPAWSPWLYMEPEAKISYRGNKGETGHGYDWSGDKVGAGGMTLLESTDTSLKCDLKFLKPFKSQADVSFVLEEKHQKTTQVTWTMESHLPFFMFWMSGTMTGMIHSDYRRGLALLKDYIEIGRIRSSSTLFGIVDIADKHYVGHRAISDMSSISNTLENSFALAKQGSANLVVAGTPFCIYHKVDMKNQTFDFTAAIPTDQLATVASPLSASTRPACRALKTVHVGDYAHLGNAWALLMGEARHRKLKTHRSQAPFEVYLNDPNETAPDELITELYLPLRQ